MIPTMKSVNLIIDGRSVQAAPGQTILEAARENGIRIPTLCFHKEIEATGSCWICIVEIKGKTASSPRAARR